MDPEQVQRRIVCGGEVSIQDRVRYQQYLKDTIKGLGLDKRPREQRDYGYLEQFSVFEV